MDRSIRERRSTCLARSEQSCLEDSASWANLMTRSASKIGIVSSCWRVFSSSREVTVAITAIFSSFFSFSGCLLRVINKD